MLYQGGRQVASRGQRDDRVPDVEHAGRRHQRGHRPIARGRSASRCRPRARPARPTTTTTPGSSASRRISSPACGSASISRRRSSPNGYAAESRCRSGPAFMKRATKGDKPEWLDAPAGCRRRSTSAGCRASCPTAGCDSVEVVDQGRPDREAVDDLHRVLRRAAREPTDDLPAARVASASWIAGRRLRQGQHGLPVPADAAGLPPRQPRAPSATPARRRREPGDRPARRAPRSRRRSAASGRVSSAAARDDEDKRTKTRSGRRRAKKRGREDASGAR